MRILIIEDERRLAAYPQIGLTENGCVVDLATDGIDGKHLAVEREYDEPLAISGLLARIQAVLPRGATQHAQEALTMRLADRIPAAG